MAVFLRSLDSFVIKNVEIKIKMFVSSGSSRLRGACSCTCIILKSTHVHR